MAPPSSGQFCVYSNSSFLKVSITCFLSVLTLNGCFFQNSSPPPPHSCSSFWDQFAERWHSDAKLRLRRLDECCSHDDDALGLESLLPENLFSCFRHGVLFSFLFCFYFGRSTILLSSSSSRSAIVFTVGTRFILKFDGSGIVVCVKSLSYRFRGNETYDLTLRI